MWRNRFYGFYSNDEDDTIDSPAVKIFLIIIFLVPLLVMFLVSHFEEKKRTQCCQANCERDKALSIHGIVAGIAAQRNGDRGFRTVFITEAYALNPTQYSGSWHTALNYCVQPGDSVAKEAGSFTFHIFRKGTEMFLIKGDKSCPELCQ